MKKEHAEGGGCDRLPVWLWAIMGVFFLKTFFLAFWLIPLWDIQDEPGHYSYISDIANGKGLPVMGKAYFDEGVREHWLKGTWKDHYSLNWIVQHPPFYYAINSLILSAATIVTADPESLFRITRFLSVISGTLALFVFYQFFFLVSRDRKFSLFSVAAISFIPMFGNQSSGTTHDALLTLLCGLSVLYWAKFVETGKMKYSLLMASFLSLSAFTKSTSLLLFLPMIGVCFFYIKEDIFYKRLFKFGIIAFIAILLPGIWMLRSYMQYGVMLSTWHNVMQHFAEADLLKTSLHQYLTNTPIIDNLYTSFFGEFGWTGKGGLCRVLLLKNSAQFMPLYHVLGLLFVLLSYLFYVRKDMAICNRKVTKSMLISWVVISYFLFYGLPVKFHFYSPVILYAVMLVMFVFSFQTIPLLAVEWKKFMPVSKQYMIVNEDVLVENKFVYLSMIVSFVYTNIFIVELNKFYEMFHMVRADHGRYWFPVIPLLAICYVFPAFKVISFHKVFLLLILIAMCFNEILIYYFYVAPFYSS